MTPIEVTPQPPDIDQRALRVFLKAIELVGGPRQLVELKRLTWLPSLMEASYAVVLSEEHHWSADEIARFLGVSTAAVRHLLRAPEAAVLERLRGEEPSEHNVHIAGGLAKLALDALRREEERTQPEG
ncbi:regulator [Thermomicrobium sp. 4228-Ro]|uniref:regulator n=1 Tax=Thermomicrobium sp. 4228-Ro TaxID=2993937 RepID=UPI002248878A|nr:regulator [Thermomicrobium sp. 4228-Ro]MCX2728271.1 regulator [Thermomicrobium sp. 4228-Ro]